MKKHQMCFRVKKNCTHNNIQYFGTNDAQLNNVTFRKNVNSVAEGHVHAEWSRVVTRDSAIRGAGGNKLRTYAKMVDNRETIFYIVLSQNHTEVLLQNSDVVWHRYDSKQVVMKVYL